QEIMMSRVWYREKRARKKASSKIGI
ncbi:hypothetical protein HKBW3C_03181, partial [Candidatus Hakubella thermalkaliphila]